MNKNNPFKFSDLIPHFKFVGFLLLIICGTILSACVLSFVPILFATGNYGNPVLEIPTLLVSMSWLIFGTSATIITILDWEDYGKIKIYNRR